MAETYAGRTPEREEINSFSILDAAEQVAGSHSPEEADQAADAIIESWRSNPAEHINNSVEELLSIYGDRIDNEVYHQSSGGIIEFNSFATRDSSDNIEEIYHVHDEFSPNNKDGKQRTIAAMMLRPDAEHQTRVIVKNGNVHATDIYDDGKKVSLTGEDKEAALFEFFNRLLITTTKNELRTKEERDEANKDAKQKLEQQMYGGPKPRSTSLE